MSFSQEYKRLDNLLRDMLQSESGVTAYIDSMAERADGRKLVPSWRDDMKALKGYRHIRNRIAHETDVTENNALKPQDEAWIIDFYSRVMNGRDPLALYNAAIAERKSKAETPKRPSAPRADDKIATDDRKRPYPKRNIAPLRFALAAIAVCIAVMIVILLLFWSAGEI